MYSSKIRARRLAIAVAAALFGTCMPALVLADVNEEQELTPTAVPTAAAGTSSAILGDTAVVGAPNDTGDVLSCGVGAGAAYVYTRSGTLWTKVATLCASDGTLGDAFGQSVSITNGNIAVGAPNRGGNAGAVYVYSGSGASWTENGTILTAGNTIHLGAAVSIKGFRVAAGAPNTTVNGKANTGVTVVFDSLDTGTTWASQTFRPNGGQARNGSLFGTSVAVDGNTVLSGAPGYHTGNKPNSGNVFVFVKNGATWTQQANIRPQNVANVYTGTSVSLFQNTAAFGAPGGNGGKGAAYVYTRTGTSWGGAQTVTSAGSASGDRFGASVAVQGSPFTVLAIGAPQANAGAGAAYEFGSSGGAYSLQNLLLPSTPPAGGDALGASTGLDSGRIISGAPGTTVGSGAAYIFRVQSASTTSITGFSVTPSLTGVPYTVFVSVADDVGTGTPTGSVAIDDGSGGSCNATLSASGDPDGHAIGQCDLTSTLFGNAVTISASYGGDLGFSASSDSVQHAVTGNHLVFAPLTDTLEGEQVNGVVVHLLDGADNLITTDTTTVSLSVDDSCGNNDVIATNQALVGGVATFTGVGPKMYTVATGLTANATSSDANTSSISANFDVTPNADIVLADGFEDCRL